MTASLEKPTGQPRGRGHRASSQTCWGHTCGRKGAPRKPGVSGFPLTPHSPPQSVLCVHGKNSSLHISFTKHNVKLSQQRGQRDAAGGRCSRGRRGRVWGEDIQWGWAPASHPECSSSQQACSPCTARPAIAFLQLLSRQTSGPSALLPTSARRFLLLTHCLLRFLSYGPPDGTASWTETFGL